MSIKYNQINISVNGLNILTETSEIDQSSLQKPAFALNNKEPFDYTPSKFKGTISLNYYLEPGNEPIYTVLTGLINNTTINSPSVINFSDIYFTGYLNSYDLQLLPNSLIKIKSSFDFFNPLTGIFIPQNPQDSTLYNINNSSGISHYWSAHFLSGATQINDNNILQLEYSASIQQTPIYSIGNPYPIQIYINNINENINILGENQINANYSGSKLDQILPSLQNIKINNISHEWDSSLDQSINIPLTGMILQEAKSSINIDEEMFFSLSFSKNH